MAKRPRSGMRVVTYTVLREDIESGITYALNRAFKYDSKAITATTIHERLEESLANAILLEIDQHCTFDDDLE